MSSKAEEIHTRTLTLMEEGLSRTDAFTKIAEEEKRPKDSIRGAFYSHQRKAAGGVSSRPRRRETTPEDALADARASLQRAIDAIDREVDAAEERASEAGAEAKALKASAAERKKAISERLDALK
jgi:hypothetical protein